MKVRTKKYVMTVNKGNLAEEYRLNVVRETIKFINKHVDKKLYVKCHGRFGKNNPNLSDYTSIKGVVNYKECRLKDAQRMDVYIHAR